jgi:hypothetical protein
MRETLFIVTSAESWQVTFCETYHGESEHKENNTYLIVSIPKQNRPMIQGERLPMYNSETQLDWSSNKLGRGGYSTPTPMTKAWNSQRLQQLIHRGWIGSSKNKSHIRLRANYFQIYPITLIWNLRLLFPVPIKASTTSHFIWWLLNEYTAFFTSTMDGFHRHHESPRWV